MKTGEGFCKLLVIEIGRYISIGDFTNYIAIGSSSFASIMQESLPICVVHSLYVPYLYPSIFFTIAVSSLFRRLFFFFLFSFCFYS